MHAVKDNELLKSFTHNLPDDFNFCDYSMVWRYNRSPRYAKDFNIDVFAVARSEEDYSVIGEVKNRDTKKFSKDEALEFERTFEQVKELENIKRAVGFVFSRCGFTNEAEECLKQKSIAYSDEERWLER